MATSPRRPLVVADRQRSARFFRVRRNTPLRQAARVVAKEAEAGQLCPVLGAGVGADLGIPLWQGLVQALLESSISAAIGGRGVKDSLDRWNPIRIYDLLALPGGLGGKALGARRVARYGTVYEGSEEIFDEFVDLHLRRALYCAKNSRLRREAGDGHPDFGSDAPWMWPGGRRKMLVPLPNKEKDKGGEEEAEGGTPEPLPGPEDLPDGREVSSLGPALHSLAMLLCYTAARAQDRTFHGITYNLDTFLEEEIVSLGHDAAAIVRTRGGEWLRVVWKARKVKHSAANRMLYALGDSPEVRVLHPHGLVLRPDWRVPPQGVPIQFEKWRAPKEAASAELYKTRREGDPGEFGVVLGQKDYNQLFGSVADERNLLQLAAFERLRCLFYGVSFGDPNVDRLLEFSARLRLAGDGAQAAPHHYALMRSAAALGPGQIDPNSWSARQDLELREVDRLHRFGVDTLGTPGFPQQRRFLVDVLARSARRFAPHGASVAALLDSRCP